MFRRFLSTTLCASFIAATLVPMTAHAGPRDGYRGHYEESWDRNRLHDRRAEWRRDRREAIRRAERRAKAEEQARHRAAKWRRHRHDNDDKDAEKIIAGAIVGLAAAAIISQATRPAPAPAYRARPAQPAGSLEPWTRDWYNWCSNRYRSFNPETGFWRGYDGKTYFCRP